MANRKKKQRRVIPTLIKSEENKIGPHSNLELLYIGTCKLCEHEIIIKPISDKAKNYTDKEN